MPTYEFKCMDCGYKFSKRISVNERQNVTCPKCGGKVEQVLSALEFLRSACGGFSGFG